MDMKKIAILGSTGSIGTQTLEVVRENQDIQVMAEKKTGIQSGIEDLSINQNHTVFSRISFMCLFKTFTEFTARSRSFFIFDSIESLQRIMDDRFLSLEFCFNTFK